MKAVVKLRDCHSLLDLSDEGKIDMQNLPTPSKNGTNLSGVKKCIVRLKKINLNNIKDIIKQSENRRKKPKGRPTKKGSKERASYTKKLKRKRTTDSDEEHDNTAKKRRVNAQNEADSPKSAHGKKKKISKELANYLQKKSTAIYFRLPESNQFKKIRENIYAVPKKGRRRKSDEPTWKQFSPRLFRSIIRLPRVKLEDAEKLMKPKKSVSFLEAVRVFGETDDEEEYYDEEETTELEDGDAVVNGHVEEGDSIVEGKRCLSPSARKMLENRCSTPLNSSRSPEADKPTVKMLMSPASKKMYETTNVIELSSAEDSNSSTDEDEDIKESTPVVTHTADKKETSANSDESFVTADEVKDGNDNSTDLELCQIKEAPESVGISSNSDSESMQHNNDKTSLSNGQINDKKDSDAGEDVAQIDQTSNESMPALNKEDGFNGVIENNTTSDVETNVASMPNNLDSLNTKTVLTHNNNIKMTVDLPDVVTNNDQDVILSSPNDDDGSAKGAIDSNSVDVANRRNFFDIDQNNISAARLETATGEEANSSTNKKLNISTDNDIITLESDEISTSSEKFNLSINKECNDKNNESSLEKVFNTELNSIKQNCENHLDNRSNDCMDVNEDIENPGGYVSTFERQMSFDDLMNDEQTGKVSSISDAIINNDAIMGSPQMIGEDDSNSLLPATSNNIPTSISLESQDSTNLDGPLKLTASDNNDDLSDMNEINKALGMDTSELDDCDQNKSGSSSKVSEPSSYPFSLFKTIKNKFFPQSDKSVAENSMNSNDKFSDLDGDNILDLLNINDDELLETNLNDVSLVASKSDSLLDDDILCNTEYSISK